MLAASVAGSSHRAAGAPCADACALRVVRLGEGHQLLAAVASDGAGTSLHAATGARIACEAACDVVEGWAPRKLALSALDDETLRDWVDHVRERIAGVAPLEHAQPRDFAATLLLALVDDEGGAVFAQVGDGAIVYRDRCGAYVPAVWPQSGEYASSTPFVTDPLSGLGAQIARAEGVEELALLTDGLQRLALRFASREAHGPFFAPMFAQLRAVQPEELDTLQEGLRAFLDSEPVNARTDDDKTLVLLARGGEPLR